MVTSIQNEREGKETVIMTPTMSDQKWESLETLKVSHILHSEFFVPAPR